MGFRTLKKSLRNQGLDSMDICRTRSKPTKIKPTKSCVAEKVHGIQRFVVRYQCATPDMAALLQLNANLTAKIDALTKDLIMDLHTERVERGGHNVWARVSNSLKLGPLRWLLS